MSKITNSDVFRVILPFLNHYVKCNPAPSIMEAVYIRNLYGLIVKIGYPEDALEHIVDGCPIAFGEKFKRDAT